MTEKKYIRIPAFATVLMMGTPGAGKSTFAKKYFKNTAILSSDVFRSLICDDENNQTANKDAFNMIFYLLSKRLARKKLTVIDATNVKSSSRKPFLAMAKRFNCPVYIIALLLPEDECYQRNMARTERNLDFSIIHEHHQQLMENIKLIPEENFAAIYKLNSQEELNSVEVIIEE